MNSRAKHQLVHQALNKAPRILGATSRLNLSIRFLALRARMPIANLTQRCREHSTINKWTTYQGVCKVAKVCASAPGTYAGKKIHKGARSVHGLKDREQAMERGLLQEIQRKFTKQLRHSHYKNKQLWNMDAKIKKSAPVVDQSFLEGCSGGV